MKQIEYSPPSIERLQRQNEQVAGIATEASKTMPTPTVTSSKGPGDRLTLIRSGIRYEIDLSALHEVWLVHIGDDFAGPNEHVALLVSGDTVTPVALNHHSLWRDLRPDLERLASIGRVFEAEATNLPTQWVAPGLLRLPSADAIPIAHPKREFDLACQQWVRRPMTEIPETMP